MELTMSMCASKEDFDAQFAALVKDAERYRWLRANHETYDFDENLGQLSLWEHKKGIDYGMKSYAKLDAAIDSAMPKATAA